MEGWAKVMYVNRQNKTIQKYKEIDGVVVNLLFCCQYGEDRQYKRRSIYPFVFLLFHNEMLCTINIIVFSLGKSIPMVLSGEV